MTTLKKVTVVHLRLDEDQVENAETHELEWPHGFSKEDYLQYMLNFHGSLMINVMDLVQTNAHPSEIIGFVEYATQDQTFCDEVANATRAGIKGDLDGFETVDGETKEVRENENVVAFPGKRTLH